MRLLIATKFECGHFLPNHPGKCRNFHGHSYKMQVSINGTPNLETGMIEDFSVLRKIIDSVVEDFDHTFLVGPGVDLEFVKKIPGVRVVPYIPTAENMAIDILDKLRCVGSKFRFSFEDVMLWETEDCCAIVSAQDVRERVGLDFIIHGAVRNESND